MTPQQIWAGTPRKDVGAWIRDPAESMSKYLSYNSSFPKF